MSLDQNFKYESFQPTWDFYGYCDVVIEQITAEAPSDATVKGFIRMVSPSHFEGELRVISSDITFQAGACGRSETDVMSELARNIHAQVESWRETRWTPRPAAASDAHFSHF